MNKPEIGYILNLKNIYWQLIAACCVGLFLGASSLWLSPNWVIIFLMGVILGYLILTRPEVALLGILVLQSTFLYDQNNPKIHFGMGTIYLTDILFLVSFGLIGLRWIIDSKYKIVRTPLDLPLITFYFISMVSTFIGILDSSLTLKLSLGEIRKVTNYLSFFIVTNLVREKHQLSFLVRGIFFLATITAGMMCVQFLLGSSSRLLPGRVETLAGEGQYFEGITRVIPPGLSIIFVTLITLASILVLNKFKADSIYRLLQFSLVGTAVLLSFFRNLWVNTFVMIITLAVLVKGKERQKLIYGFFLILFFGILLFFFTSYDQGGRSARLVRAVVARFSTLQNSSTYDQGSSLRWRDFEYQYALPQIASHPVLGLGMGAMYRPLVQGRDHEYYDGRTYIHNGHVWIILKSGILGYLSWLYLSLAFLYRGFKYWQLINEPWMKAIVLGFTLSFLAVFIGSLFEPMVMEANWTSLLGIMMGTNEVIFIMNSQEHS